MIIDTHCHYNIPPLWDEQNQDGWKQHWNKAVGSGIVGSVVVGVNTASSMQAVEIAKTEARLIAAVGFHPTDDLPDDAEKLNSEYTSNALQEIEKTVRSLCLTNQVSAIGEVGLDYFRLPADPILSAVNKSHQKATCALQLRLAAEFSLPLILHVRDVPERTDAYFDMLTLLKENAFFAQPFILHCVSGPPEYIREAIKLGGYIGVAGNVTYKSAQAIRDIVLSVPKERVLLETDAPFLAPVSHRGKPCEPWMITETAEFLKTELDQKLEQIVENTMRVFPQFNHVTSQDRT